MLTVRTMTALKVSNFNAHEALRSPESNQVKSSMTRALPPMATS